MTGIPTTARVALLPTLLVLAMAGCDRASNGQPDGAATRTPAADEASRGSASPDQEASAPEGAAGVEPAGFDLGEVPVSQAALGEFPYLRLPAGYVHDDRVDTAYDRVAFWTGDRLAWVEGRVFSARVLGDKERGKTFALLEFQRNMQAAIRQAGGQRIAEGRWPRELRDELKQVDPDLGVRYNGGLGDIWNRPVETFVIRRPDRAIWIQVTGYQHGGSLLMAETAPVEITAGLLEAEALKQQLEIGGRVAIEVNFAVDKAEILRDSQPQIAQVVALLRDDPSLRLSIDGHTDATGEADHNLRLSEARAQAVVAALVAQGIESSRLAAKGHGQSQPVADNETEEGRAQNRRVELVRLD